MNMSETEGRFRGGRRGARTRTRMNGGCANGGIVAILVTVIRLADAQGGVALDDGVRVWATRDNGVDGGGGDEGEVEEGEQEKVTSVDRHRGINEWKDRSATGESTRKSRVLNRQRATWNP